MNENSYLDPAAVKKQCAEIVNNMEEDIETTYIMEQSLKKFIADDEIQSVAFDMLKQQIYDYLSVLQAVRDADNADIQDCAALIEAVGKENLDGSYILQQEKNALSEKEQDEERASSYEKKAKKEELPWMKWYYNWRAKEYWDLADIDQKLYESWKKKENCYDEIEANTESLFTTGENLRDIIRKAFSGIEGAFQNGEYVPDYDAGWRTVLSQDYRMRISEELLSDWGYTQEEIDVLVREGIILTYADMEKLQKTVDTEKVFVSDDKKALFYKGNVYRIYVPDYQTPGFDAVWDLDGRKEVSKKSFDLAAGVLGIDMEELSKDKVFTSDRSHMVQDSYISGKDKNVKGAAAIQALMGLNSFLENSLSSMEITMVFESDGNDRRVTIGIGDSKSRDMFRNMNYDVPVNTYKDSDGVLGKKYASDYAAGIYQLASGNTLPEEDATYTIIGTLSEQHKDANVSGFLSYSNDGKLLFTPLVYAGDTAYIATCQEITGWDVKKIYDFTDLLSNATPADEEQKRLFEKALEGDFYE